MLSVSPGEKIVLPSPNGGALALAAAATGKPVIAASFRNISVVTAYAASFATVAVLPAGERWPDRSLRPCVEDVACAGAVIEGLTGSLSPEAAIAAGAWESVRHHLHDVLLQCSSGRQLVESGYAQDVQLAAELDVSPTVPALRDGRFAAG